MRKLKGFEKFLFSIMFRIRGFRRFPKMKVFAWGALQLDRRRFIKRGTRVRITEAKTMEFIAANTTIPVPRVLDTFTYNGTPYIIMEYVEAFVLEDVWPKMTTEEKLSCMDQLKGYLQQLRELICPEPGKVQAVDGSGCWDDRLNVGEFGPYDSHEEFNAAVFHQFVREHPESYPEAEEPLKKIQGKAWRTVFTHGDLGPHNILWKNGKIVSIIDWEHAGWFPEYWEYTRTYFGCRLNSWWEAYQSITETYPDELAVERLLASYFVRI
jgi:serine/threonine protein kinase